MGNDIQNFFDSLAPHWDEESEEKLPFVVSLLDQARIKKGSKVLDLACGTGIISGVLHDRYGAEVLGLDISGEMIKIAMRKYEGKEGVRFLQGDFYSAKGLGRFDYVICHNAFPHFLDVEAFLARAYDSLVEGGEIVVFHSLGRERLRRHHDGLGPVLSRDLEPVEIEAGAFAKRFAILEANESENHFWIRARK